MLRCREKRVAKATAAKSCKTKLTGILIETLYRFEGSEEMKNLQMHLENCTGKMKRKDENVKIQSRLRSGSDTATM